MNAGQIEEEAFDDFGDLDSSTASVAGFGGGGGGGGGSDSFATPEPEPEPVEIELHNAVSKGTYKSKYTGKLDKSTYLGKGKFSQVYRCQRKVRGRCCARAVPVLCLCCDGAVPVLGLPLPTQGARIARSGREPSVTHQWRGHLGPGASGCRTLAAGCPHAMRCLHCVGAVPVLCLCLCLCCACAVPVLCLWCDGAVPVLLALCPCCEGAGASYLFRPAAITNA